MSDGESVCCVAHQWTVWYLSGPCAVFDGASVRCVVHEWTVWCLNGLCAVLDGASVDRVVPQWNVRCLSGLCDASVDCVVPQWRSVYNAFWRSCAPAAPSTLDFCHGHLSLSGEMFHVLLELLCPHLAVFIFALVFVLTSFPK